MKKIYYVAVIVAVLLLISACESGGDFYMENRTSFPVYASVDGEDHVTIPGGEGHTFKIDTDTQTFLTGEVKRKVPVHVLGQTFSLYDREENQFVDDTEITIRAGKTLNAFLAANRASIKVVNDHELQIERVEIFEVKPSGSIRTATIQDIAVGQSRWKRVNHATPQNPFSFRVYIWLEGADNPLEYGDYDTILAVDEQWVVTVSPPPQN